MIQAIHGIIASSPAAAAAATPAVVIHYSMGSPVMTLDNTTTPDDANVKSSIGSPTVVWDATG
jgi:hypothetical protein